MKTSVTELEHQGARSYKNMLRTAINELDDFFPIFS